LVLPSFDCRLAKSVSDRSLAAILLLITPVAYANSFGLGLPIDSRTIITEDTRIGDASLDHVRLILTTDYWWPRASDRLYRPLTILSYLFNCSILGIEHTQRAITG
jgi:hypothetical protein